MANQNQHSASLIGHIILNAVQKHEQQVGVRTMEKDEIVPVQLTIEVEEPFSHWELLLARRFPSVHFTIYHAKPTQQNTCSGLLKCSQRDLIPIKDFVTSNEIGLKLQIFDTSKSIFCYQAYCPFAGIVACSACFEIHPKRLTKEKMSIKLLLQENDVDEIIKACQQKKIPIRQFSKVKAYSYAFDLFTEKQHEIFLTAVSTGFYSFPKKISLLELAKTLQMAPSTLCVHLQKIESKIVSYYAELEK